MRLSVNGLDLHLQEQADQGQFVSPLHRQGMHRVRVNTRKSN